MAASGIVQKRPGKALPPRLQHRLEGTPLEVRLEQILEEAHDAQPGDGGIDQQIQRRAGPDPQRAGGVDTNRLAGAFELPDLVRATGELTPQTGVGQ